MISSAPTRQPAGLPCISSWKPSILLALALAACGEDEVPTPTPSLPFETRLESAFDQLEAQQMPVIVGISHRGGPLLLREFGALAEDDIPPERTQLDINSITKTVTAVMVAKLVEQGRLRFEDTLGQLLPDVPSDKTSITLHQLLTHTAGFPEASGDDDEALTREAFLARALAMELRLKPGARYAYSNVGYGVLAAVAEIVSERSYEQLLRENVLRGPEFPDTGYQSVYEDARSMRSPRGETIREASWGGHDPGWNLIGNGGLVSSLPDMIHFRQALTAGEILSQASLDLLHTKHVAEDRRGRSHYGYGLVVQDVEGLGRVYWHDGGNDVFSAQWAEYVDQGDLIFTAGADSRAGDAFEAMQVLADALYGGT